MLANAPHKVLQKVWFSTLTVSVYTIYGIPQTTGTNHVIKSNITRLFFPTNNADFNGNTMAMYLSTAIRTKLSTDTTWETPLEYIPSLQTAEAKDPVMNFLLVSIPSVAYSGQLKHVQRRSDTAMLTM